MLDTQKETCIIQKEHKWRSFLSFRFFLGLLVIKIERQAKILQMIRERGYIENDELARLFNVTSATIRRDLKGLSEQNLVRLDHGGASDVNLLESRTEPVYETKVYVNHENKRMIGQAAAGLVVDGDTILLDSGTTSACVARSLRNNRLRNLTVITCDIMVAKELGSEPNINVLVLGGILRYSYYSLYGPYTEMVLKNLRADKFFLGVDAVSIEHGVSNIVLEEVPIKQLMIAQSSEVIMIADGSKFGRNAPYRVCDLDAVHQVVTDHCISASYLNYFEEHAIRATVTGVESISCD